MKNKIEFIAKKDKMLARIINVPGFVGEEFEVNIPESIGSTSHTQWFSNIQCTWEKQENGDWLGHGFVKGELDYTVNVIIGEDHVDFIVKLTNMSNEAWEETHAFNCVSAKYAPSVCDHDCKRHWVRSEGEFKKLVELPRVFGPRPALQLYNVEGAPKGKDIPFVASFQSTPEDVAMEGWFAIQSRDGKSLMAVASKPILYAFQNREYSCVHSSPTFGPLNPGETGSTITRIYMIESSVEDWYSRMKTEFKNIDIAKL